MGARIPIRRSEAAGWARRVGALPVPVLVIAVLAHRGGFLPTDYLLGALAVGFVLALIAFGFSVYALADIWVSGSEGAGDAAAGFFYALPALLLLALIGVALVYYPPVNDVTTDLDDPPALSVSTRLAANSPQTVPSPLVGIPGRLYDLPLDQVYDAAEAIVMQRGWEVAAATPPRLPGPVVAEGGVLLPVPRPAQTIDGEGRVGMAPAARRPPARIEAIARTLIMGIPDRVSIRLDPSPEGVRVDVRSASAVGEHDLGENGRRIRAFLADLDAELQGRGGLGREDPDAVPEMERP